MADDKLKGGDAPLAGGFRMDDTAEAAAGRLTIEDGVLKDNSGVLPQEDQDAPEQGSDTGATDSGNAGEEGGEQAGDDTGLEGSPDEIPEAADLGEFKEADQSKWDGEYLTTGDGGAVDLNMDRLGAEWWKNAMTADKYGNVNIENGKLNAGTYEYLKKRFGVTEATIKSVEKGILADAKLQAREAQGTIDKIVADVGGDELVGAAIEWAKAGGYTEAQRARFNAARKSGDPEAIRESLEVVVNRFQKSGGKAPSAEAAPAPARQPKKEVRNVTQNAPASGSNAASGEVYASMDEYNKDLAEARKARQRDERKGEAMRAAALAKLARSPFYRKQHPKGR